MAGWLRRARGGLLSQPIDSLLAAVEQDQYERAVAETAATAAPGGQQRTPGRRRSGGGGAAGGRASLWVEKYAPKGYIDLLSDEQINRWAARLHVRPPGLCAQAAAAALGAAALLLQPTLTRCAAPGMLQLRGAPTSHPCLPARRPFLPVCREVVRWLKGWDPIVFGTAAPDQLAREARGVGSRFHQPQPGQAGGGGSSADPLGRPEHKVILIAGPPGGMGWKNTPYQTGVFSAPLGRRPRHWPYCPMSPWRCQGPPAGAPCSPAAIARRPLSRPHASSPPGWRMQAWAKPRWRMCVPRTAATGRWRLMPATTAAAAACRRASRTQ